MPIAFRITLTLIFSISCLPIVCADSRPWKSADGAHTMQGEFVKRDVTSVTIRNTSGKDITIELPKLHPDEITWLNHNHSLTPQAPPAPTQDPAAFFEDLTFLDTRETTLAKLKASKLVEMTTDETFIGRSGLNGIFRTRQKIGNLNALLFFDWSEAGNLKELTLQTDSLPEAAYKSELEPSWRSLISLLDSLYGTPTHKSPLPQASTIVNGSFSPSHLWHLEGGGSVLLGTARDNNKYQLVVRFTQKKIDVVAIP